MAALPDEIWREILKLGIQKSKLIYKDLCCISISSKSLNKLSNEDTLWSSLLTLDFPQTTKTHLHSPPIKDLYKSKFEKEKERKLAAHRRAVLRIESRIAIGAAKLKELKHQLMKENEKLKAAVEELMNLERVRSASVALKNVWQPEVVRGKHKSIVQQCVVPVESRSMALQMEIKVCKQQIEVLNKGYGYEKQRVDVAKRELGLMNYHPLRNLNRWGEPSSSSVEESSKIRPKPKMLKLFGETCPVRQH